MTTQTKPEQPKGNFAAFFNRTKQQGDNRPLFIDGRIGNPGSKDEYSFNLWPFEYADKDGVVHIGFNGSMGAMSRTAPAIDQIQHMMADAKAQPDLEAGGNLKVAPHQVVLFTNKTKFDAPDKDRPTHYGFAHFGDGTPLVKVSAWLGKDRYDRPVLTGSTQFPLPAKETSAAPAPAAKKIAPPPPPAPAKDKSADRSR